jgi:nitrile hydratase subunit beta
MAASLQASECVLVPLLAVCRPIASFGPVILLSHKRCVLQHAVGATKTGHVLRTAEVVPMIAKGFPSTLDVPASALFHTGQRVRGKNINPVGHTRLPRYARGKVGTIVGDYGVFSFPDACAQGLGDKPQHVYSVRFAARELWGEQAVSRDSVYADLWDDHLEPA